MPTKKRQARPMGLRASKRPAARAAAPARKKRGEDEPLTLRSFMAATNGGGSPEDVPGFDIFRTVTAGFETRRIAGPTLLASRPDGGFFSQSAPAVVGSPAAKPENVIGADNRVIVTNTSMTPWRCICHLEVEYEWGPAGFATGFLISGHAVITAAHVLVDRATNGWANPRRARRVRVVPGRSGTLAPYGYFVSEQFEIPDDWAAPGAKEATAPRYDFAAICIPKDLKVRHEDLGKRLGYFGLKALSDKALSNSLLLVNNAGYPHETDKPYGTLWYNAGRVGKSGETYIEYMVDTEGGQSGSPIYFFDETKNERYVVAIHTTGDFINRGLRITPQIFGTIRKWANR